MAIAVLLMATLFCNCNEQKAKQSEEKTEERQTNQISEKCIALLAYGLLSDDEGDVPFGGACKEIASDSLVDFLQSQKGLVKKSEQNEKIDAKDCIVLIAYELLSDDEINIPAGVCKDIVPDSIAKYLQLQKHIFKRWQKDRIVDAKEITLKMGINTNIRLLEWLIGIRTKIGPTIIINDKTGPCDDDCEECGGYGCALDWPYDAEYVLDNFGGDYSFIWKLYMLGYYNRPINIPLWSCKMREYAQELKKYSKNEFLIKYYDKTLQGTVCDEPLSFIDRNVIIEGSRSEEETMHIVKARAAALENIYKKYLKLQSGFNGKVTFKFIIAPNGIINSIAIISSTTGYYEFDNAVKDNISYWKWKPVNDANTIVTISFNFTEYLFK
jgi:hypothetical protein